MASDVIGLNFVDGTGYVWDLADGATITDVLDIALVLSSTSGEANAMWAGRLPLGTGIGPEITIPYAHDGTSRTFTCARAFARVPDPYAADLTFVIEKSAGGGAFSASTVATVTILTGNRERTVTGLTDALVSGSIIRPHFTAVGPVSYFELQLTGLAT
jgi:hypothetical protein